MSAHQHDLPKTSPPRPKHQVTRSITELSSTFPKLHRPHHHHHHHPHLHKREHREKEPQSAHPNLQTQEGRTKSEGVTPNESRAGSRRASHDLSGLDRLSWERFGEKRIVKEGEVMKEKERSALRSTELRNAILGLNTLSNSTTRRLDNTYYGVLEKLSVLQNTIVSMKELATMTKQLSDEFITESEEVTHDVETQVDGFAGFEDQQKRIGELQERVAEGRDRIKTLGGRVDIVRARVEGWQKSERAWQEKTRKRLRIMWVVMTITIVALLGLVGFQYTPARSQVDTLKGVDSSILAEVLPDLERIGNKSANRSRASVDALEKMLEKQENDKLEEDPRLRLFDEL